MRHTAVARSPVRPLRAGAQPLARSRGAIRVHPHCAVGSRAHDGAGAPEQQQQPQQQRAKKGMFEGDLVEGELEIGQVASQINKIISAESIIKEFIKDYNSVFEKLKKIT